MQKITLKNLHLVKIKLIKMMSNLEDYAQNNLSKFNQIRGCRCSAPTTHRELSMTIITWFMTKEQPNLFKRRQKEEVQKTINSKTGKHWLLTIWWMHMMLKTNMSWCRRIEGIGILTLLGRNYCLKILANTWAPLATNGRFKNTIDENSTSNTVSIK